MKLNLDIWSGLEITKMSGYNIENLKKCLRDLALFIK